MNNDLISRSALLKRVDEEREYLKARGQFGAEHILVHNFRDLIENAPTVEPRDNYDMGYVQGLEDGRNERPQGEWIDRSETDGYVECPFCGSLTTCWSNKVVEELHYCFNCGAELGKGGAE